MPEGPALSPRVRLLASLPPRMFGRDPKAPVNPAASRGASVTSGPHSRPTSVPTTSRASTPVSVSYRKRPASPTTSVLPPLKAASPARRRAPKSNPTSAPVNTRKLQSDRLGTLVRELADRFVASPSWESFVEEFRGRSYLSPDLDELDHPAAALLREWRDHGVPVETSTKPWSLPQKDHCVQRGCHPSATKHSDFI